jgi:outer membrane protein TolC
MNVAEIYVNVLRATRIVGLAQSKVVSLTAHTRDVTSLFEKGLVSKNDLLSAQVALADARQQSLDAQNSLELAYASYNRALGRPLTQPVRLAELRDGGNLGTVDDLTQRALQQRPELAAIAHQVQALREQAASERAKNLPQVAITGGYVYQRDTYVEPNGAAVLMLGAQWNIMDCGRVRHQADALCEKAEAAVRLYKDSESMIALEVRRRWLELQTARQRVEVARQTTNQADENLRVARDRYQQQVGTNTEVLDAETLRIQAYTNFLNSSYQAVLAGLRLRRAAGEI